MKNKRLFFIFLSFIIVSFSFFTISYAKGYQFEKSFFDLGYKEVNEALKESEEHFEGDIVLPIQLPPIVFTHNFGRLSNLEGEKNDNFEITYLNQNLGQNNYKIEVRSIDYKLRINEEKIDQKLKLNDGSEAIFSTTATKGFNIFVFEKGGWQYILFIDKRISDEVTPELFIEIANSINY